MTSTPGLNKLRERRLGDLRFDVCDAFVLQFREPAHTGRPRLEGSSLAGMAAMST
jgi:hypothetical protein